MHATLHQGVTARRNVVRFRFQFAWVAFVLGLAAARCLALDPERTVFQFNCRTWTHQNGLPADGVNAIAQTPDGYLWLGTTEGLVSFDGIEFKPHVLNYLQSQIVTSLSASRDGGLWVGMERGAFAYCNGEDVTFRGKEAWGGVSLNVQSILETDDHAVWLAAESQAARLSKEQLFQTFGTNDTTAVMEDSKGRVWLGTAHRGLFWWENGVLHQFPDHAVDAQEIRALAEDKSGQMWIGTDWGPLCYDSNFLRKDFPFPWYPTRALLVDREGTLWMGTTGAGLVQYRNGTTTSFRKQDGLADDNVAALAEDQEGNLWVGTRNGLSQFNDVAIPAFTKTEGLPADVIPDICASRDGGLWLATGHGFSYFDGKDNSATTLLGLTNEYVNRIFEARNGDVCLINAYKEVEVFRGANLLARYTNEEWPSAISEDAESVVAAVGGKLFRVSSNSFSPFPYAGGQQPELGWIFNIAPGRDGCLWLATDVGIGRIKADVLQLWTTNNLGAGRCVCLCEGTAGVVWAGLDQGLARLKDGKVVAVNRAHGLFDNIIYAILPDNHGRLWVDSSRGFFSLATQNFDDFASGRIDHVTCTDFTGLGGVKSSERFQQNEAGCKTLDGRLWFPTAQGLVMIDPDRVKLQAMAPRIYIQNTRADGKELRPGEKTVRPGKGDLDFQYASLSYIAPLRIHYRYQLDGYDKEWVDAGTRRSAFYTNLKPGPYRFLVEACNEDGVWSAAPASIEVELLPHFYQTAWFISLAVAAFIGSLCAIYAWRLKHLTDKQQQLQRARDLLEIKVQERTFELAGANTALQKENLERKQAEEALRSEEERTRLIIDQAFDAVISADVDFRILSWNRAAEKTLGWTRAETLGCSLFDTIIPPSRREKRRGDLQRFRATGEWEDLNRLVQTTAIHRDGRELPVELTITPVRLGDYFIFTLFLRDITERKQAEAALAFERHLLESLLENSADGIYFKDRESRLLRCSKSQSQRFGGGAADHIGKTDFDFFSEEHARPAFEDELEIMRTGCPLIGKAEKEVTKDGRESWVLTSKMPLRNKAGEIVGTFGISKDISAIKQAEAELERAHKKLVQASRLAGMAEVATNVLHNVGNVLNSINVSATLVEDRVRDSRVADVRRLANLLEEHAEDRAAFLTEDPKGQRVPDFISQLAVKLGAEQAAVLEEISSLCRNVEHVKEIISVQQSYALVAGVFEDIKVTDLVEDSLRMNADSLRRHDIKVVRDFSILRPICTDKHKVLQILINLVRNAKYACDESGRSDKQVILRATNGEGRVKIAVIDNGVGIPPENLTRIFNHGFTTRKDGHGFGLHSGALAAKELGGSLTAYSEGRGHGAVFTLELPCQPATDDKTKIVHNQA
jgi:PAS domain S-box-containing protein